jgi:hypothetical protein
MCSLVIEADWTLWIMLNPNSVPQMVISVHSAVICVRSPLKHATPQVSE